MPCHACAAAYEGLNVVLPEPRRGGRAGAGKWRTIALRSRALRQTDLIETVPYTYELHGLTLCCEFPLPELASREVAHTVSPDITVRTGTVPVMDGAKATAVPFLQM